MTGSKRSEAQIKAEKKYGKKRVGTPTFSAVRLDSKQQKKRIDKAIEKSGMTRKEALIKAFELFEQNYKA